MLDKLSSNLPTHVITLYFGKDPVPHSSPVSKLSQFSESHPVLCKIRKINVTIKQKQNGNISEHIIEYLLSHILR